jgi:hypothetical protein
MWCSGMELRSVDYACGFDSQGHHFFAVLYQLLRAYIAFVLKISHKLPFDVVVEGADLKLEVHVRVLPRPRFSIFAEYSGARGWWLGGKKYRTINCVQKIKLVCGVVVTLSGSNSLLHRFFNFSIFPMIFPMKYFFYFFPYTILFFMIFLIKFFIYCS